MFHNGYIFGLSSAILQVSLWYHQRDHTFLNAIEHHTSRQRVGNDVPLSEPESFLTARDTEKPLKIDLFLNINDSKFRVY